MLLRWPLARETYRVFDVVSKVAVVRHLHHEI